MNWYFAFFFVSGFCSILYELIWLRLTVAQFGVTVAMTSIVLSVFMAGMGAGAWLAGSIARRGGEQLSWSPLRLYASAELLIGCASLTVPVELLAGRHLLESWNGGINASSAIYYLASGLLVAVTLLPWCACMGATVPLAMWAIRRDARNESGRSFSFLYTSNVMGAIAGALIPLILIEVYGFHASLCIGACLNATIAVLAFALSFRRSPTTALASQVAPAPAATAEPAKESGMLVLLFLTGFATMSMEVIWIRLYTAFIGPFVYSFALILASYLIATAMGAMYYRERKAAGNRDSRLAWMFLGLLGLLPMITADPRVHLQCVLRVIVGVLPVSCAIGYLTPMLVDRWSGGDAHRAGKAYAINVAGCILGPLFASFVLLPYFGERAGLSILALPWFAMIFARPRSKAPAMRTNVFSFASLVAALLVILLTRDYTLLYPNSKMLRDSTATVIAYGSGMGRRLATNGIVMTYLTPITKMMAHFPLAMMDHPPQSVLVICFGMGTSYRSALSWGVPVTVVELVPSVPKLFPYFHEDGAQLLALPRSHLVIDDGRRFLERTNEKFDLIVIDPPPPVSAAASSLLYSEEFYAIVRQHMQPGGILAQWLPNGDDALEASVTRALTDSFPHVRIFKGMTGPGRHFFASMDPLPARSADEMLARMPASAIADMMEWGPKKTPRDELQMLLSTELTPEQIVQRAPGTPALRDDRPINEYCILRGIPQTSD